MRCEITCEMCMDLMPLVRDGVASEDSRLAVEDHIRSCPRCRDLYGGETVPPESDGAAVFRALRRRMGLLTALVMLCGAMVGLGLTNSSGVFYNSVLMPVVGALGYGVFRRRAVYLVPGLLLALHLVGALVDLLRGTEALDLLSILLWTGIYSLFALAGMAVVWLLRTAFGKER